MADFTKLTVVELLVLYLIGQTLAAPQTSTTVTPDAKTKRFHDAIKSCSILCQSAVNSCLSATSQARYLMAKERYCDVMNLNSGGVVIRKCLLGDDACTQREFHLIRAAACSGAKSVGVALSMVVMALCFSYGCVFQ